MKRLNKILFFLTIIVGLSCEKTIDFTGEETKPKIVFYSNLYTDSIICCEIGLSYAIFESQYNPAQIKNAEVKLFENDVFSETLSYLSPLSANTGEANEILYLSKYTSSGKVPDPNVNYKFEVSIPNYPTIESSTSFPTEVIITNIDTQLVLIKETIYDNYVDSEWSYEFYLLKTKISFKDPAQEDNYYRLVVEKQSGIYAGDKLEPYDNTVPVLITTSPEAWIVSNDPLLSPPAEDEAIFDSYLGNDFRIFSDEMFSGKEYELSFELNLGNELDTSYNEFIHYNIQLQTISKDYYLYLQSYSKHKMVDGDFFSEPVIVYSNINNGLGIFGAINSSPANMQFGNYPVEGVYYEDERAYWYIY